MGTSRSTRACRYRRKATRPVAIAFVSRTSGGGDTATRPEPNDANTIGVNLICDCNTKCDSGNGNRDHDTPSGADGRPREWCGGHAWLASFCRILEECLSTGPPSATPHESSVCPWIPRARCWYIRCRRVAKSDSSQFQRRPLQCWRICVPNGTASGCARWPTATIGTRRLSFNANVVGNSHRRFGKNVGKGNQLPV